MVRRCSGDYAQDRCRSGRRVEGQEEARPAPLLAKASKAASRRVTVKLSKFGHDQIPGGAGEGQGGNGGGAGEAEGEGSKTKPAGKKGGENDQGEGAGAGEEGDGGRDTGELTSWPKGRAVSDPDRMSKPLLLVEFDGRSAAVLLNRRPPLPA
jgi:ParB family chromosome partitioning protein